MEGDKLEAAKKFAAFVASQPGCDAWAKGTPPTGPVPHEGLQAGGRRVADRQGHPGLPSTLAQPVPALEFKSPIKGPALEQICIQVGTGQVDGKKGAELYDQDVKKQAQQLGLPGWE